MGATHCASNKSAPDRPEFESIVKFFDDKTRKAFDNSRQEITKHPKPTPLREQGKNDRIKTCAELLRLLEAGLSLEKARVGRVFSEYRTCLVLTVLRYAQAPRVSYFDHEALSEHIFEHLDLSTLRSSLYPRLNPQRTASPSRISTSPPYRQRRMPSPSRMKIGTMA